MPAKCGTEEMDQPCLIRLHVISLFSASSASRDLSLPRSHLVLEHVSGCGESVSVSQGTCRHFL